MYDIFGMEFKKTFHSVHNFIDDANVSFISVVRHSFTMTCEQWTAHSDADFRTHSIAWMDEREREKRHKNVFFTQKEKSVFVIFFTAIEYRMMLPNAVNSILVRTYRIFLLLHSFSFFAIWYQTNSNTIKMIITNYK